MQAPDFPALRDAFNLERSNEFAAFRKQLTERVLHLLNHDTEKLRWILYRVDVSEKLARQAFDLLEAPLIAAKLADLLIEREARKHNTCAPKSGTSEWLDA
ncbi:MAG TPA: hypothetical protein VEY71_01630 [Chitinophagales bacterium]|nr:hypothetical protein [Chitinophagales bacterium]